VPSNQLLFHAVKYSIKKKGKYHTRKSSVGNGADPILGSQPAGDSMHSHEPGGGLLPPPTRPTATHMHTVNPVMSCPYFLLSPQLPPQPSDVTAHRPVPGYTAW